MHLQSFPTEYLVYACNLQVVIEPPFESWIESGYRAIVTGSRGLRTESTNLLPYTVGPTGTGGLASGRGKAQVGRDP